MSTFEEYDAWFQYVTDLVYSPIYRDQKVLIITFDDERTNNEIKDAADKYT